MALEHDTGHARPDLALWARWIIGTVTAIAGPAVALLVTAVGHCSAFGGRCPADPVPLLQNDVFGMVATSMAITIVIVSFCLRPGIRGVMVGMVAALPIGVLTGLAAGVYARG